jgi:hypothetical protein
LCKDNGTFVSCLEYKALSHVSHWWANLAPLEISFAIKSLGILKAFNPGDVFQAVSLQLLQLGLEKGVGWQM